MMRSSPAGAAAGQNNYSITIIVKDDASLCAPAPHGSHFYHRTIHREYRTLTITNVYVLYILSNWLYSIQSPGCVRVMCCTGGGGWGGYMLQIQHNCPLSFLLYIGAWTSSIIRPAPATLRFSR